MGAIRVPKRQVGAPASLGGTQDTPSEYSEIHRVSTQSTPSARVITEDTPCEDSEYLYRLPSEYSEPPKRLRPQRTSFEWAERQAWTAEYPGREFREIGVP